MRPPRAALALAVVVVLAGCLGFGGPPPSDPGAEAVVDDAAASAADIETYRFESDIRIVASDGEQTRRITMDNVGTVDRPARKLQANTTFRGDVRRSFVDGDKVYTECEDPWGWCVENVSDDGNGDWRSNDPLGRQVELLQSSHVYWAGNETIDGVDVHVIEARPSDETLSKYTDRRQSGLLESGIEDATSRRTSSRTPAES